MIAEHALVHVEQQFAGEPPACRSARDFVVASLSGLVDDDRLYDARTVVSELTGNAIKYTLGAFRVAVDTYPGYVEVHVVDSGCGVSPQVTSGPSHGPEGGRGTDLAEGGRGHGIVADLADDSGTRSASLCACHTATPGANCWWFRMTRLEVNP